MRRSYKLYGSGEPVEALLEPDDDGTIEVRLDEQNPETVALTIVSDHLAILRLSDGRNFEVPYYRDRGKMHVSVGGREYAFEVLDRMQAVMKEHGSGAAGSDGAVSVGMPGRVIKVLVEEGQQVELDEGVIIVEAMKMENELKAPVAGTVASVNVSVGDTVEAGNILIKIDPDS